MKSILEKIFVTPHPIIGMVHFMPLVGYPEYPGYRAVLKKALKDAKSLVTGGVDGIMVENNYDVPHRILVGPETVACMTLLTKEIIGAVKIPVGVNVLWNDYRASLVIAELTRAKFVRIPVFVDKVRTAYGDVFGEPAKVLNYRKKIKAEKVAVFADIQVKHARMLVKKDITSSAKQAVQAGAEAIIITGEWTGDPPNRLNLWKVRNAVGDFPVLIGSGTTKENLPKLLRFADGVIAGTAFKSHKYKEDKINLKSYLETIQEKKVKEFVQVMKNVRMERR